MFGFLKRRDNTILAACSEPSERVREIAQQERYRVWFFLLGSAAAILAVVTSFSQVRLDKSLLSFIIVLASAAVGMSQATSSIRLLRLSEWVERSNTRKT